MQIVKRGRPCRTLEIFSHHELFSLVRLTRLPPSSLKPFTLGERDGSVYPRQENRLERADRSIETAHSVVDKKRNKKFRQVSDAARVGAQFILLGEVKVCVQFAFR